MSGYPLSGSRVYLVMLACMLVLSAGIVSAAQVEMSVDEYTLTGDSVLETGEDITYVTGWQSYSVEATVEGDSGAYQACLVMGDAVDEREIECKVVGVNASQSETVSFEKSEWPENMSGRQTVSLVVRDTNASDEPITTSSKQVNILGENGDYDGDSVSNRDEIENKINPRDEDTDGDELSDGKELTLPALPNNPDTDGDGLSDGIEVNKHGSGPDSNDTDGDDLNDRIEVNVHGTQPGSVDSDKDGLNDKAELKEHGSDPTTKDSDEDGLKDQQEVNILKTDPDDVDSDSDGLNDDVEADGPTHPTKPDTDSDGLTDGEEKNQYHTNPLKPDTDGDGVDDADEIKAGTDPNGQKFFLLSPMEYPMETAVTGAGAILVLALGGGYWWRRRRIPNPAQTVERELPSAVSDRSPIPSTNVDGEATDESTVVTREPLTDEDRIQQLLDESGGRLHQSEIVSKTGWSKSKVSRLLSRMEEDGLISKISVGRENLIARSGDEPRHAGSTFED